MDIKKKVYKIVKKILKGKVLTYKQVAEKLGNKNLARVVGNILSKNKDLKVPCHRVIRSNGHVGGYNRGVQAKVRLLECEGVRILKCKVQNDSEKLKILSCHPK